MDRLNQVLLSHRMRTYAGLDIYRSNGGGQALEAAIENPLHILKHIKKAGLRGLGGSGYPTYLKWQAIADQNAHTDKYLICNGNEDEPGTFKDRLLMEETPHQLIEGALIAAVACGLNKIIFYINPDLKVAIDTMRKAVEQWLNAGLYAGLNRKILSLYSRVVELQVVPGSGHYIGGEETAAIESVEGKFPFPRGRPPYPVESGVYEKPTLVNNIETLCNVPHIISHGIEWYQELGVGNAYGTKLFSLSGDVRSEGVYELPMGISLNELIFKYGNGLLDDKKFKAVFTGGPSNTLLTHDDLDVALDFDSVRERGSNLGTGAMIVVSEGTDIIKKVAEYVHFFAHSSCGQCPSCKTGTYHLSSLLDKIDTGHGRTEDLAQLVSLCKLLPGSGKCALIDGAVTVVSSSLDHFMSEYKQALR